MNVANSFALGRNRGRNGRRLACRPVTAVTAPLLLLALAGPARLAGAADSPFSVGAVSPPGKTIRRAQVQFTLNLVRVDAPATAAPSTPDAAPVVPITLATPILTTTDLGAASVTVTGPDLGYTISLSPTLETAENSAKADILTLWSLRLNGRSLPAGTTSVSLTGAKRVPADGSGDSLLAEVPLVDAKTGQTTRFRLFVRTTVTAPGSVIALGSTR